jgi:hypothetical protein
MTTIAETAFAQELEIFRKEEETAANNISLPICPCASSQPLTTMFSKQ